MSPIEFAASLHGKFFTQNPFLGYALVGLVAAGAACLIWMLGIDRFNERETEKRQAQAFTRAIEDGLLALRTNGSVLTRETSVASENDNRPSQSSTGNSSPNVVQGPGSVFQQGDNNRAIVNNAPPPWTLSDAQRGEISTVVRRHSALWDGKANVVICIMGDSESTRMAEAFVRALREGGWQLPPGGYAQGVYTPPPVGIEGVIGTQPHEAVVRFLEDMSGALNRAGLITGALGVQQVEGRGPSQFEIRIGRRS